MAGETFSLQRDLEYAVHDGVSLKGHLWKPAGRGPHPVLVTIHGGGWRVGSADNYLQWGPVIAEHGIAMFSICYRLTLPSNKAVWPQAANDVRAAVQYIRGRATELDLDGGRIAMMGDSAGAHLSALIALAGDSPLFAGAYPEDPSAIMQQQLKPLSAITVYMTWCNNGSMTRACAMPIISCNIFSAVRQRKIAGCISTPRR